MAKRSLLIVLGLCLMFVGGCGDDASDDEKDSSNEKDSSVDSNADDSASSADGIDGLTACTDFQTASWDRIRECDSPLADSLPPNTMAGAACSALCPDIAGTVTQEEYDTCVAYAQNIECADIDVSLDAGASQIPDDCSFLADKLGCLF